MSKDAGIWAGLPLAFIREDFEFYDCEACAISHAHLLSMHRKRRDMTVHIRFCFDKSKHNFSIRKFQSTEDAILNPVDAAVSII
jgi:hypothetical protein